MAWRGDGGEWDLFILKGLIFHFELLLWSISLRANKVLDSVDALSFWRFCVGP